MKISRLRFFLYKTAKYLGDINSVSRKRVGKRITNRIAGKVIGTNDLTTIIVIFIVILNYHRYYFIKIRMVRD